jgi:2-polyprenyl-3-methyl-5-hydroxy-6-metoxy-1,4-benzoquinol methylase
MNKSNEAARSLWEHRSVGYQRANNASPGSVLYFANLREYRYGYETPFIPQTFDFNSLNGKRVLEIGVGNGIDAVEMMKNGALYTGLDVTKNHLELTRTYIGIADKTQQLEALIEGDLLATELPTRFDVIYSFGVLHHIAHESAYLSKLHSLLKNDGELRIAVYSKYSFFNAYLIATWFFKNRLQNTLRDWQSHVAELSDLGAPVTIKIRSKREIARALREARYEIVRYEKRGFVQNYIPLIGRRLKPDGSTLTTLASLFGWYHCFICKKA